MYKGPGLAWEQDQGLEPRGLLLLILRFMYTDEEVECSYEEFYEDVHTEFLKFGEKLSISSPEDDQNSRRKTIIVQSYESSSPGQYNGRSKSQDLASEYFYNDKDDDDDDDDDHWESNEYASEEHHQSRSKSTCDDKDQFIGKSNTHNKHSSELYNERRSRGSS
ncbi:hypothetical protein Q3G72_022022 [Acer saccharum]|nr:hypothetical protein Q3G72_022022 [Acer saccharum]